MKLWCWVGGKVQGHFVTAKRVVVLCSDEGLTLETSGLKLFTIYVVNSVGYTNLPCSTLIYLFYCLPLFYVIMEINFIVAIL